MKTNSFYSLLSIFFLTLTVFACGDVPNEEKAADAVDGPITEDMIEAFNGKRENLQRSVQGITEKIEEKTKGLRQELDNATIEERRNIQGQIAVLEEANQNFNRDMKKLGENIAENWGEFRNFNEWDEFSNGLEQRLEKAEALLEAN